MRLNSHSCLGLGVGKYDAIVSLFMVSIVLCPFLTRAGRYLSRRYSRQSDSSVAVSLARAADDRWVFFAMFFYR